MRNKSDRLGTAPINKYFVIKRILDVLFSFIFIVILAFPMALIWCAVVLSSRGGGIFRQTRIGQGGRRFTCYKFRTMYINAPRSCPSARLDASRFVTPLGKLLRRTSLDELPQLFNVLLGDMSLVGPRPPLPSEVRTYTLEERKRLNITPGITCLWQVSGRSELPFSKQIALDKEYIASRSAWKDFVILLKTVPAILTGKGAW